MKYAVYALLLLFLSCGTANAETCTPTVRSLSSTETELVQRWQPTARSASRELDVPVELIERVMYLQSSGNPDAVSYGGALGLMQIMPMHWNYGENWRDPTTNVFKGTKILRSNYEQSGSWINATRMYIGGGTVANEYIDKVWACPVISEPDKNITTLAVSTPVTTRESTIVATARQYVGLQYVWGGVSPQPGFDCSGLVYYVMRQNGLNVPRDLWGQYNSGQRIGRSDLKPGDIIFFQNTYAIGLSHVGIYIGNDQFVHAASEIKGVIVSSLSESYWIAHYLGATRP